MDKLHVGVIGAGLAGLRCADVLLQKGLRVTILEARDRIGGRVCQTDIGGVPVDLGPNWIHGTEDNPIVGLSKRSSTVTHSWDGMQAIIGSSGQPVDPITAAKLSEFMWTTVDKALAYSQHHGATIPVDLSLFDYFREELEKTSFTKSEQETCLELSKLWGSYIGSPVDRQSLKFFFLEECLEGTNLFVASTYKNILQSVAQPVLNNADIHLNEPVVSIEAEPHKPDSRHRVIVSVASGKKYDFDEVVATFPLGWLKRNMSAFTPALPKRLSTAIDNISYGQLEKVYVRFPKAFWHINADSTGKIIEGESSETESIPAFTQFLHPSYVNHPPTPFWNQECLSLASLPESCAHPTLLFYLYGPCAAHIVNQLSAVPRVSKEYNTVLEEFLKPYYSRLPGYDIASPSCKPLEFLATDWQLDPWAGNGSYSNFQVGLQEGDKDIETMREGVGNERGLWFAGEHTAPFVALGTTAGAYWSGELVAEKVYGALRRDARQENKS
ncbi:hypothetical protein LOZ57_002521 [Ophidiomyces ophidiicola]|uniref:uncharacterized protein n=1 Tax=Ophidiomyces ophidiicola TaxID=1387563 RepID=UPI0020C5835F|nr:uncharacterized protein LOZ57_002521 [Ophidiomyces ophidiicola]KAI1949153.1 hypothetical protein LOZ57_002521 [Ophidiomyces ophidiicola]KAI2048561.1 hypothetical protein LOZ43_005393 [Ophidiomyces ophidiicola]